MGFFEYLDGLRAKPERTRARIAFGISLSVTLVILIAWSMSFYASRESEVVAVAEQKAESPLKSVSSNVAGVFASIKNGFLDIKSNINGLFSENYEASTPVLQDTKTPLF